MLLKQDTIFVVCSLVDARGILSKLLSIAFYIGQRLDTELETPKHVICGKGMERGCCPRAQGWILIPPSLFLSFPATYQRKALLYGFGFGFGLVPAPPGLGSRLPSITRSITLGRYGQAAGDFRSISNSGKNKAFPSHGAWISTALASCPFHSHHQNHKTISLARRRHPLSSPITPDAMSSAPHMASRQIHSRCSLDLDPVQPHLNSAFNSLYPLRSMFRS